MCGNVAVWCHGAFQSGNAQFSVFKKCCFIALIFGLHCCRWDFCSVKYFCSQCDWKNLPIGFSLFKEGLWGEK